MPTFNEAASRNSQTGHLLEFSTSSPITRHSVNKLGFKIEYIKIGLLWNKKPGFFWNKKFLNLECFFDLFSVAAAQDISRVRHVGGARVGCFMPALLPVFCLTPKDERLLGSLICIR